MRCGDRASILRYYGAGKQGIELRPEERRAVEDHLAGCPRCARLGRTLAPAGELLGAMLAAPVPRRPDCPQPEILDDYFHRRLPRWSRARVRAHLRACERCLRAAHDLAAAPATLPRREVVRSGGRRVWIPLAVAAPGYLLALLALTGQISLPRHAPATAHAQLAAAGPPAVPDAVKPAPSGVSPPVQAELPPGEPAPAGPPASAAPPPAAARPASPPRGARARGTGSHERSQPAESPVPPAAPENVLSVQAIDLAMERCPGARTELARARELVLGDRLPEAARVLEQFLAGDAGRDSLAVGSCLALIHLADPGRDPLALAALSRSLGTDDEETADDQAIRIVHMAAEMAPRNAERTIRSVQAYQEGGELPFEALLLAGIVLDQPGYREQSRTVLRAARKWLERDLKAREPTS
jgi:hypothetical protein